MKILKIIVGLFMMLGVLGSIGRLYYNEITPIGQSLVFGIVYAFLAYVLFSSAFKKPKDKVKINKIVSTKKVKAFFIAPLLIPLSLTLILYMFGGEGTSTFSKGTFPGLVFIIGIPITYLSILILGIPVYLHLESIDKLSYVSLFTSGGLAGSIVAFALITEGRFSFKDMSGGVPDNIIPLFIGISMLCGVTAIIYGKIAKGL